MAWPASADLPGAAEMRAAGLLVLDLPADFAVPDPNALGADEDPLDDGRRAGVPHRLPGRRNLALGD